MLQLWPEGEAHLICHQATQSILRSQHRCFNGPELQGADTCPQKDYALGKGDEKPAGSLPRCLADNAAIHLPGLGVLLPGAHSCHSHRLVVNGRFLLPRQLWIHKRTKALDVLNLQWRHRAVTMLCCHLTEEAHSLPHFQAQTLNVGLWSLIEAPYP